MIPRNYDVERDREAARRIWREVGWLEAGCEESLDRYIASGRAVVAEVRGEAECLVCTQRGTARYLDEELAISCCTGVTTSRVARKQGLAGRLLAKALSDDVADGMILAGLGMFEQGFYTRLGYGTGAYEVSISFDPSDLRVDVKARPPYRLTRDDWEQVHAARLARMRTHGGVNVLAGAISRTEMEHDKGFGLGYRDGQDGAVSHFLWMSTGEGEHGPYRVCFMGYQTVDQFLELMGLLRNLGDQVHKIDMHEPPLMQIQDLIVTPFKRQRTTENSRYEVATRADAYWQARMLDLNACLAHTKLDCSPVRFNLQLEDPIVRFLPDDGVWRGCGGDYVVTLGAQSGAEAGVSAGLPTLRASVGAFTRMWLGVRPASGLAVTDQLAGDDGLIKALDRALRLPVPKPDWNY